MSKSSESEGIKPTQLLAIAVCVSAMTLTSTLMSSSSLSYDKFASSYDSINNGFLSDCFGIKKLRAEAGRVAYGKVLEVAVGTGLQLPYYQWDQIEDYLGIDSSEGMLMAAKTRFTNDESLHKWIINKRIVFSQGDVEKIDAASNSFDSVVDTFSLCVFHNPKTVLQEMQRVVKPGGSILLVENTVSKNAVLAYLQSVFAPILTQMSKNCNPAVDVRRLAEELGLHADNTGKDFVSGMLMFQKYKKE
jgi:ubiquinone/menaquinone biosynthesis C-methylase UbiE